MAFQNTLAECNWLRETHLRGRSFEFKSFSIIGNVDLPEELAIYATVRPATNEIPVALFRRGGYGLQLQSSSKTVPAVIVKEPIPEVALPRRPTWLDFAKEEGLID